MPKTDILTRLGGGNHNALEKVPSARPAFKQMALTMIFTSVLATLSMLFAMYDAVHAPAVVSVLVGLFWGAGILVTDRTLMLLGTGGSRAGMVTTAATRLVAAALIGVIVSTPLTLRLFSSDIRYEIGQTQLTQGDRNGVALANSPEKRRLDDLDRQIVEWQDIQAGQLPAKFASDDSATVARITKQLSDLQTQESSAQHAADQAAMLYQCERYGGGRKELDKPSKCAPLPGPNGNANLYLREARASAAALVKIQQQVVDVRRAIGAARKAGRTSDRDKLADLQKQAPAKLRSLADKRGDSQKAYDDLNNRLNDQNLGNDGLLAQITALWKAGERQKGLMVAHILLALLFVLIEFMPVLSKIMWQAGRTGRAYEGAVETLDATGIADAEAARSRAQIDAETQHDLALVDQETELDERRLEAEQHRHLIRTRHEAARRLEQIRAEEYLVEGRRIDAEFATQRLAELRRRAEADHESSTATAGRERAPRFGNFPRSVHQSGRSRSTNQRRWGSWRRVS